MKKKLSTERMLQEEGKKGIGGYRLRKSDSATCGFSLQKTAPVVKAVEKGYRRSGDVFGKEIYRSLIPKLGVERQDGNGFE